jgi:hypothetical protein
MSFVDDEEGDDLPGIAKEMNLKQEGLAGVSSYFRDADLVDSSKFSPERPPLISKP